MPKGMARATTMMIMSRMHDESLREEKQRPRKRFASEFASPAARYSSLHAVADRERGTSR